MTLEKFKTVPAIFGVIWFLGLAVLPFSLGAQQTLMANFEQRLQQASPQKEFRVLIYLKDQLNVAQLGEALEMPNVPASYRHRVMIENLQSIAWNSQANLIDYLSSLENEGKIRFYRTFWILNAINLEAPASVILSLAKRPDIQSIVMDGKVILEEPVERLPATSAQNSAEKGLKVINAPRLWQKNIKGQGVIVMNIDTGVDGQHPALKRSWRGAQPGVSVSEAWFDPEENTTFPVDPDGHGTHTMGVMVGLDTLNRDTIGVAFEAQWIAAKVLNQASYQSNILAALQWAADPDGNPYTVDDVPAVINCSWQDPSEPYCATTYWDAVDNVEALGTAVIFSAGNQGPLPQTITPPKNRITTPVNFFAVGAIDPFDPNFTIAPFSSRGPSRCDKITIKPEVTAPGVNIRSANSGGGYATLSGTSTAAPHASGAVALLRSAYPFLSGTTFKYALLNTAMDLGTVGEDNDYGMGLIDVWAAYLSLSDPIDPAPPSNLLAYSDYRTPTSIQLRWEDPAHLVNGDTLLPGDFTVQIERDSILIDSVPGGIQFYDDNGLIDGQQYKYRLYTKIIANDSISVPVEIHWFAGGAPTPVAPRNFRITGNDSLIRLYWQNPSENIDGTPLDDFAGIYLYQDSIRVATFKRTTADTARLDSAIFVPSVPGYYEWYLTAFDDESPSHESLSSTVEYTPLPFPFQDNFDVAGVPNSFFWNNYNAEVNDRADQPPSPPYALNLNGQPNGGDVVELKGIDLSGKDTQGIIFSFSYQPQGRGNSPEVEDSLWVDFKNQLGDWVTVRSYPGSLLKPFQKEILDLTQVPDGGGSYFHPDFRVRFRSKGARSSSTPYDDWFIDDVYLGPRKLLPEMIVYPLQIIDTLFVGQSSQCDIRIQNGSNSTTSLDYTILATPSVNWLQFSPVNGSIAAGKSDTVHLIFSALNLTAGNYEASLIISGNDINNPTDTVSIRIRVENPPEIQLSADTLFLNPPFNWKDSVQIWIKNTGAGPLKILSVLNEEIAPPVSYSVAMSQKSFQNFAKGENAQSTGEVIWGRGGPDAFGYFWVDSREPDGPLYQFTDISTTGDTIQILPTGGFAARDEGIGRVTLPFPVLFYGRSYQQLVVSTNGFISFDTLFFGNSYNNQDFPSSLPPNNVIAALWDDLSGVPNNGKIFIRQIGNQFIIQWDNWSYYDGTESMKFQIVLFNNSSIVLFNYENVLDRGTGTVGIENAEGTVGLTIAYNQVYAMNHLATRISTNAHWLKASPVAASVAVGDSLAIWFKAYAEGLNPGLYMARSLIQSNDPLNPTSEVAIQMTVQNPPTIQLPVDTLNFDSAFVRFPDMLPLQILNKGTGDLFIKNIYSDVPQFTADTAAFQVAPGDSYMVNVSFTPSDSGKFQGVLTVLNNDPVNDSIQVFLEGIGVFPPQITVSPVSIALEVTENDSADVSVRITNEGQSSLVWQAVVMNGAGAQTLPFIQLVELPEKEVRKYDQKRKKKAILSSIENNISATTGDSTFIMLLPPTSGKIPAGEYTDLNIRLYGVPPLSGDTLRSQIIIQSNDPIKPAVVIPVKETVLTGIPARDVIPKTYYLYQNFPNPFNPSTKINFKIPRFSSVKLIIYDILGREIRTLLDRKLEPGSYEVLWQGRDDSEHPVSSGIYLYRLMADDYVQVRKMLLIR